MHLNFDDGAHPVINIKNDGSSGITRLVLLVMNRVGVGHTPLHLKISNQSMLLPPWAAKSLPFRPATV